VSFIRISSAALKRSLTSQRLMAEPWCGGGAFTPPGITFFAPVALEPAPKCRLGHSLEVGPRQEALWCRLGHSPQLAVRLLGDWDKNLRCMIWFHRVRVLHTSLRIGISMCGITKRAAKLGRARNTYWKLGQKIGKIIKKKRTLGHPLKNHDKKGRVCVRPVRLFGVWSL